MAAEEGSVPVPNLAGTCSLKRHFCFILPGTDIEVSVARMEKTEEYPNIECLDYMVYFRRPGMSGVNLGYLHINTKKREAEWSISEVKL